MNPIRLPLVSLSLLLTTFLLPLSFLPSPTFADDEFDQDEDGGGKSATECVLSLDSKSDPIPCEYSIFSPIPPLNPESLFSGALVPADPDGMNLGCEGEDLDALSLRGKIAIIRRGVCPFTTKILNVEAAGAIGAIVGDMDAEPGKPVRMKGTGEETQISKIPSMMVDGAAYEALIAASSTASNTVTMAISGLMQSQDVTDVENVLKGAFYSAMSDADAGMKYASWLVRSGWPETGRVVMNYVGNFTKEPAILYSIGEYFHNIEEDVNTSAKYFLDCMKIALYKLKSPKTAKNDKKAMMSLIKDTATLVPERREQSEAVNYMEKEGMTSELRKLLKHLYKEGKLGTRAVLSWAKNIKDIGYFDEILETLEGSWFSQHMMADDPDWVNAMEEATKFVKNAVEEGESSGEL